MHGVWELSAVRQVGPPALVDPSPGGTPACGAGAQQVTQNEPSAIFTAAQAVLRYLSLGENAVSHFPTGEPRAAANIKTYLVLQLGITFPKYVSPKCRGTTVYSPQT